MFKKAGLLLLVIFLSGCATYKFQRGQEPYDKGYVALRDDYLMPEYTIGPNNSVPDDLGLAKQRFAQRRRIVENYYKRMGYIENRFKMAFWDPPVMFMKFAGGILRLPFIAVSDYRYNHNPAYKERIKKIEEDKDAIEEERIQGLKDRLNTYIQGQLARQEGLNMALPAEYPEVQAAVGKGEITPIPEAVVKKEAVAEKEPAPLERQEITTSASAMPAEQAPANKPTPAKPVISASIPLAIIEAHPVKGVSPLRVRFSGDRSHSASGRIVSYHWDFGDGDTSAKANPVNTYWSGSLAPKDFTIILTVEDSKGNTATATAVIEVLNR